MDIEVPDFLPKISFYFGNPATNTTININCYLSEEVLGTHYIYYSYFISLSVPLIHFLVFTILLKIRSLINNEVFDRFNLKAGLIFLFTYF